MTAPSIAIIDYGIGNVHSVNKALERQGARPIITNDAATIAAADAVVLPGVGAFGACMRALRGRGLEACVRDAVEGGRPFLGICVGTQMLFTSSAEDPAVAGLGIIAGEVEWIPVGVKRPQMQWNRLHLTTSGAAHPTLAGLGEAPWVYFVHSLHGVPDDPTAVTATCEYGGVVNAAFAIDNVLATQFHPEKSGPVGLRLLANFVAAVADRGAVSA